MGKEVEASDIIEWFVDKSEIRHDSDLSEDEIKELMNLHLTGLTKSHKELEDSFLKTFEKFREVE